MVQIIIWLVLLNFILLLAIGLVRQDNPFEVWLLGVMSAGNAVAFIGASVLTHQHPLNALTALATNLLPFAVPVFGALLLLSMMSTKKQSRRLRHYRPRIRCQRLSRAAESAAIPNRTRASGLGVQRSRLGAHR